MPSSQRDHEVCKHGGQQNDKQSRNDKERVSETLVLEKDLLKQFNRHFLDRIEMCHNISVSQSQVSKLAPSTAPLSMPSANPLRSRSQYPRFAP
jgi:hypothetical protein